MQLSDLQLTLPVMIPSLRNAFGLSNVPRVAFVGSGGKSTALFHLAREYPPPVIVTATSHLEIFQAKRADHHFYYDDLLGRDGKLPLDFFGVTLFSGPKNNRSVAGLEAASLRQVLSLADEYNAPLLIEADGSRRHPVKAPAEHEPPIPDFVDTVVVTVGLSALGQPCTTEWVHRPKIYADLSGLQLGDKISLQAMERVLCHSSGGLKNIPSHARRVVLLNQADSPQLRELANELAEKLIPTYHAVIIAALQNRTEEFPLIDVFYSQSPFV
jgi:molybdenum cofactor cytidylyltransferase